MKSMMTWNVMVDGKRYDITLNRKGKATLDVNGEIIPVGIKSLKAAAGYDKPFNIGEKEARLVVLGNKVDIAVDGVYVNSGKPYFPLKKVSWDAWIFVAACLAIPVVAGGGAIPFVLGFLSAILCARISIQPETSIVKRVVLNIIITGIAWGLYLLMVIVIASLAK